MLGPAFVAAIAYVDPCNVEANLTAEANFGYLLEWVLVVANLMVVLVQYQLAKLGLDTGLSVPGDLGQAHGYPQAPAVVAAGRTGGRRDTADLDHPDVAGALMLAGVVNIAMLLLAASSLRGIEGTDTIVGALASDSPGRGRADPAAAWF